ncbi:MAG TPA: methyltransferase domain-containing protein [Sulfuriferula sp.]|nr:methyltransferase domain-containing protein [Sulfuriferula sp.]
MLGPRPGESLLDVGCGTGYFARQFARADKLAVTGLDPNRDWLVFAEHHAAGTENYVGGSALALPFANDSFDLVVSVTALCFVADQRRALAEMLRVTRRRVALGLLNRHSLLYWQKGRGGGQGAYRGAHWHTAAEVRELFAGQPVRNLRMGFAIFAPGGEWIAWHLESVLPASLPLGSFLAVTVDVI